MALTLSDQSHSFWIARFQACARMSSAKTSRLGRTRSSGSVASGSSTMLSSVVKSGFCGVHVEDAGQDFALVVGFHQHLDGVGLVGGVVVLMQLAQTQVRAVVQLHVDSGVGIVVDGDVFEVGHEADFADRLVVLLHVLVALGRAFVIVEGDAGRDDVEQHRSLVRDAPP